MPEPDKTDDVLDTVVEISDSDPSNTETDEMGTTVPVPESIHQHNMSRLESAGASAHEHFVQFGKILDLAYEADRKMVSLTESLGVREVTSKSGQMGIPRAVTEA